MSWCIRHPAGELERRGEEEERVRREVEAVREQESQLQHELQVRVETSLASQPASQAGINTAGLRD